MATVESAGDVDRLPINPGRVSYVVAGSAHAEHAARLAEALRARHPRIRAQHPDGLCYATADRAETVRSVRDSSDTVLLLGDPPVPGGEIPADLHPIATASDIRPEWLLGAGTIGLVSTAPDPSACREVIRALSGLGPLSVARRRVTTEILKDW